MTAGKSFVQFLDDDDGEVEECVQGAFEAEAMGTIGRLRKIYGGTFMSLVSLCYFLQSFRSFPWMAMTYWYKDNLKVSRSIFSLNSIA